MTSRAPRLRSDEVEAVLDDPNRLFELVSEWVAHKRWLGARRPGERAPNVELLDSTPFSLEGGFRGTWLRLTASSKEYLCPLLFVPGELKVAGDELFVVEAELVPQFWEEILGGRGSGGKIPLATQVVARSVPERIPRLDHVKSVEVLGGGDTTNLVVRVLAEGASFVVKSYRRVRNINREVATLDHLTRVGFPHSPKLYLTTGLVLPGVETPPVVHALLEDLGSGEDAGAAVWDSARRLLVESTGEGAQPSDVISQVNDSVLGLGDHLGGVARVVARFHEAMRSGDRPPFQPGAATREDVLGWVAKLRGDLDRAAQFLADLPGTGAQSPIFERLGNALGDPQLVRRWKPRLSPGLPVQPVHEDLHLGQLVRSGARGGEWVIIDHEGDPQRVSGASGNDPEDDDQVVQIRRLPVQVDLAALVRATSYIKLHAIRAVLETSLERACELVLAGQVGGGEGEWGTGLDFINEWERRVARALVSKYCELAGVAPDQEFFEVLSFFTVSRAASELRYELEYRPARAAVPATGLLELLQARGVTGPN
ncbi:MAG: hypothetical protein Kow0069_37960 [Promethearchaeota archaeon]